MCGDVINDVLVETGTLVRGEDNPAAIRVRPGGSAANQAAWLAHLGVDVVFAGRVGARDREFHRRELARFGVEPRLAADDSAATGTIVVLVGPDGERTMLTDRGANLRFGAADVPAGLPAGAALLHLTGYSFFEAPARDVALDLLAQRRRGGGPFTIDPGSASFLAMLTPGEFLGWTRGAAVCLPNLDEAAVLSGTADAVAAAAFLTDHYGAVVITLGADGALCATAGSPPVRIAAKPARVRDTTGAGDAFRAGFLSAWLNGGQLEEAAEAGTRAAALAVAIPGGRPRT